MQTLPSARRDVKDSLTSARKADVTHVRYTTAVYMARAHEYGSKDSNGIYPRGNFALPAHKDGYTGTPTREDFLRMRAYLRALISHALLVSESLEMHHAGDPELVDVEGMKRAAYAVDTDASETATRQGIAPSGLPHIACVGSSLNMLITQGVLCGLLPADPGRPWEAAKAPPAPGVALEQSIIDYQYSKEEQERGRLLGEYEHAVAGYMNAPNDSAAEQLLSAAAAVHKHDAKHPRPTLPNAGGR